MTPIQTSSNMREFRQKRALEFDGPLRHNPRIPALLSGRPKNSADLTQIDSAGLKNQNGPEMLTTSTPALTT